MFFAVRLAESSLRGELPCASLIEVLHCSCSWLNRKSSQSGLRAQAWKSEQTSSPGLATLLNMRAEVMAERIKFQTNWLVMSLVSVAQGQSIGRICGVLGSISRWGNFDFFNFCQSFASNLPSSSLLVWNYFSRYSVWQIHINTY